MFDHLEGLINNVGVQIIWGERWIQVEKEEMRQKKAIKKIFDVVNDDLSPELTVYVGGRKKNKEFFELLNQKCPENFNYPIGPRCEDENFFFGDHEEAMSFFIAASTGSSRNSVVDWSILNQDNYKNKPTRLKIPNLN
jgi:hypothetical protein